LPAADRERAFFAVWTQKEAYVKARGLGLMIDLKSFEVDARGSERGGLLCADSEVSGDWFVQSRRSAGHALAPWPAAGEGSVSFWHISASA
jgi:phosphopantetheinyl transferase